MKKFQFSLDHVRDYRDRLLDEETGKLQRLRAEQTRIEQLIAQLEADFAQVSQAMRDAQAEGITALEQRGFSLQLESIRMQTSGSGGAANTDRCSGQSGGFQAG
mgnify:CR=1 FL=1